MKDFPHHQSSFILDKPHFAECYEASITIDYSVRAFAKAIFFVLFGMVLVLLTEINAYMSWFIFSLGIIEALSVYYQKPWWVTRQMLSKASKSEVTLVIDQEGIHFSSFYNAQDILWDDIDTATPTSLGWVIHHKKGKHYLSNQNLSADVQQFLNEHYV